MRDSNSIAMQLFVMQTTTIGNLIMAVALDNNELKHLRGMLKSGEYDGADLMRAWLAIDELIELREWRDKAFQSHPNIDIDIEHIDG